MSETPTPPVTPDGATEGESAATPGEAEAARASSALAVTAAPAVPLAESAAFPPPPQRAPDPLPELEPEIEPQPSFRAALFAVIPAVPILASIATVMIYVAPQTTVALNPLPFMKANPLMSGTSLAVLVGVLLSWIYANILHGTSADHANSSGYSQLCQRLRDVEVAVASIRQRQDLTPSENGAWQRATASAAAVRTELAKPGSRWILGTGYINMWALVHRAEEQLILVEPVEDVIAGGLYDELRLDGSQIDNSADLLGKLRSAIVRLQPSAAAYLNKQPPAPPPGTVTVAPQAAAGLDAAGARAALRDVRGAINEFRGSSFDALVRSRNHLVATLTVTGFATYLLLTLAINGRASDSPTDLLGDPIAVASILYVVGAVVGMFNRLYSESRNNTAVEDYGLTVARMTLTPVLAGLAALGGVLVVSLTPSAVSGDIFAASSTVVRAATRLEDIYNLHTNPIALLVAAVFGLTPSLLIAALQNASDRYKDGLSSTASQSQTKP